MIDKYMYTKISIALLFVFFVVTSYAAIFPIGFVDDLIVIVIGLMQIIYLILYNDKIKQEVALIFILLSLISIYFVAGIIYFENGYNFNSFFVFVKIIIFYISGYFIEFNGMQKRQIIRFLVITSVPNIIYNFYEILCTYIKHTYLPGKYNSAGMYRLQGMTGHPIFYSFLLVVILVYLLYYSQSKFRYLYAMVVFIFCMLTWSSLAQVAAILLVGYYAAQYTKVKNRLIKNISIAIITMLCGILVFIFLEMIKETYTIRYISVIETLKNLNIRTFFIGDGFGSYTANGLSESYMFHVFYDSGILGIFLIVYIVLKIIKIQIKKRNYACIFVVCLYFVSMIINEGYMIPFIVFIPILCGEPMESKKKKKSL